MQWLDPNTVPTLGDWFRAGGYQTHYRGKWHVSFADLTMPGSHEGLKASDDDGNPLPAAVEAYRKADRLDPFGFSGWIGREPHGADKSDCGTVRDGVFAEQVVELFGELATSRAVGPWLTVASFVNPHDIAFSGFGWEQMLKFGPPTTRCPTCPSALSVGPVHRPACVPGGVQGGLAPDDLRDRHRSRLPEALLLPSKAGGQRPSGASSRRSNNRAWPTRPSSCSRPTTVISSVPMVA